MNREPPSPACTAGQSAADWGSLLGVVFRVLITAASKGSDLFSSLSLRIGGACVQMNRMARRLRIQYHDAICHVMARGNGRQAIVRDDTDRDRLHEHLGRAAIRCGWHVYAFVIIHGVGPIFKFFLVPQGGRDENC
jgi:hypothetical protein